MIKGIIFDFDGTVVDSTQQDYQAFKKALQDYNIEFSYQQYIEKVGSKGEDIVRSISDLSDNEIEKLLNRKAENFKALVRENGLEAIKGVEQLLLKVKEFPLWTALATGSKKDKVNFIFDRVKLEQYFDLVLTADDVNDGKPSPSIYLNAAKQLQLDPKECLVFEDAFMGIKAAKNAKMKCVAIATSSPKELLKDADLIIDSYQDFKLEEFVLALSEHR